MGGTGGVAGPAANDERAIGAATSANLSNVVSGEVRARVGGLAFPSRAPVPDDGAVVSYDPGAASTLVGVGVEVGPACCFGSTLGQVTGALAVDTPGLAAYQRPAPEAGPDERAGHRGLRRWRWRSRSRHDWQRSPGPLNSLWQERHRPCRRGAR
jgi:hypothetical protein